MTRLLLGDSTNLFLRAWFGIKIDLRTDGQDTWAVYGLINGIANAVAMFDPTHILMIFDSGGSDYRRALYPQYKANRKKHHHAGSETMDDQMKLVQELLPEIGVPVWKERGVEADDVLAKCVAMWKDQVDEIIVYSGDKDLRQIIDHNVTLIHPSLGTRPESRWTYQTVVEKYGVPPTRLPEIWALEGDRSDNILGVQGIGTKLAQRIINEHASLSIAAMKEKRLAGKADDIALSLQLVQANPSLSKCALTLNDVAWNPPMPETNEGNPVEKRLTELGFATILTRWRAKTLWQPNRGTRLSARPQQSTSA